MVSEVGMRVRMIARLSAAGFACCLVLSAAIADNERDTRALLRNIKNVHDARKAQQNPIWVKFTARTTESVAWQKAWGNAGAETDRVLTLEAEYAVRGNMSRTWARTQVGREGPLVREGFTVYNGAICVSSSNKPGAYLVSSQPTQAQETEPPLGLIGEEVLRGLLEYAESKKEHLDGITAKIEHDKQGEEVCALGMAATQPYGWTFRFWLNVSQDYVVQRSETLDREGDPVDQTQADGYMSANGIWFPTGGATSHYLAGGILGYKTEFSVSSVKTSARDIPDSLFRFTFPDDAEIFDQDRGVTVRNIEQCQADWDRIIALAAQPREFWGHWFLLALLVAAVVGGALGLRRLRRQRAIKDRP